MPRIIVTTGPSPASEDAPVLLEESVNSVHLSTEHAAAQLVERLAWAVRDAEAAERRGAVVGGGRQLGREVGTARQYRRRAAGNDGARADGPRKPGRAVR